MDNNLNKDYDSQQDQVVRKEKDVPLSVWKWFLISVGDFCLKILKGILSIIILFAKSFVQIFIGLYKGVKKISIAVVKGVKSYFMNFFNGKWRTKISYIFQGQGYLFMKRPFYAISLLVLQIAYWIYMLIPNGGFSWLRQIGTLGNVATEKFMVCQRSGYTVDNCPPGFLEESGIKYIDNSMLILLYGTIAMVITVGVFVIYLKSTKAVFQAEKEYLNAEKEFKAENSEVVGKREITVINNGTSDDVSEKTYIVTVLKFKKPKDKKFVNPLKTTKRFLSELLNERFHISTLTFPAITITIFTIMPLLFMIMLAFTNYNKDTAPPAQLFDWVGLQTFIKLFTGRTSNQNYSKALWDITSWTFIWAFFATFSNYILGMLLALLINKAGIRFKKMWRTVFVITIAVPQFVTLLLMSKLLDDYGPLNELLLQLNLVSSRVKFLSNQTNARITVILVNIWVGVPYTMLISSGILMNIPSDLYESARIDGANPFTQFFKITLPYMLFVTGPYLITQFVGNINNFNVIFFLTGGNPVIPENFGLYGGTDILITWLFKLTVGDGTKQEYAMGSALGIFIFLISAFFSLTLYSKTTAAKGEGDFS